MSGADPHAAVHHEIIIVRHGHGDHEDGHHGGVWKIAFADFMTAMMCFFLVMWLINASNDQTKAAVASYFNPVKLIDRNAGRKGLHAEGEDPSASGADTAKKPTAGEEHAGEAEKQGKLDGTDKNESKDTDKQLFQNPYAVLAEIVSETGSKQNVSDKGDGGAQLAGPANGASGGDAYRDPFAPDFWSQQVAAPDEANASAEGSKAMAVGDSDGSGPPAAPPAVAVSPPVQATPAPASKAEPPAPKVAEAKAEPAPVPAAAAPPVEPVPQSHEPSKATVAAADEIRKELAAELLPNDKMKDGISVVATDKGVRVSVTDQLTFGMYEVGSALPRRELVLAMDKIGAALSKQKGPISIGGFTDARSFKSDTYDNWRLSTARAHSAYYMLVRGGLDQNRITEVAGYADRRPKDAAHPLSAVNRRIEVLLEVGG